jgi:hypothetical protein
MKLYLAGTYSRAHVVFAEDVHRRKPMNIYLAGNNYRKQAMDMYLAGEHEVKNGKTALSEGLMILESYVYARDNKHMKRLIPTFKSFLLDSGAFTFMMQAKKESVIVKWDTYIEQYAEFINELVVIP